MERKAKEKGEGEGPGERRGQESRIKFAPRSSSPFSLGSSIMEPAARAARGRTQV